ncbi:MAG: hypothetical protein AB8B53_12180 [Flavobacteriales bacterium]
MKKASFYLLFISFILIQCGQKPSIEGLWVVKSVTAGEENLTPNARWMRFNSDLTQESGNGWLQHSVGTYALKNHELTVINTNGIVDQSDPFKIDVSGSEMTWKRMEEGRPIEVNLVKAFQLPLTYSNQMLGLWGLEESVGNGNYFSDKVQPTDYLFFHWDHRFTIESERGRVRGVYNVNGHRPEVELIPYGAENPREFWEIDLEENRITLNLLNTDSVKTRVFKRIHEFPR